MTGFFLQGGGGIPIILKEIDAVPWEKVVLYLVKPVDVICNWTLDRGQSRLQKGQQRDKVGFKQDDKGAPLSP